jgi:hypothetical protein
MKHLKVCLGYGTPKDYLGGLLKEFKETIKPTQATRYP